MTYKLCVCHLRSCVGQPRPQQSSSGFMVCEEQLSAGDVCGGRLYMVRDPGGARAQPASWRGGAAGEHEHDRQRGGLPAGHGPPRAVRGSNRFRRNRNGRHWIRVGVTAGVAARLGHRVQPQESLTLPFSRWQGCMHAFVHVILTHTHLVVDCHVIADISREARYDGPRRCCGGWPC